TGQVRSVAGFEMVEAPFDDEPAEFAEQLLQTGLKLVGGLGRRAGPAKADDQPTDFGDHRDQADSQGEQRGGKVRCQEEPGARSIVHRGGLSRERTEFGSSCHFTKEPPPFPESLINGPRDSGPLRGRNRFKSPKTRGTGATAPGPSGVI